jgi:hypothetical protein
MRQVTVRQRMRHIGEWGGGWTDEERAGPFGRTQGKQARPLQAIEFAKSQKIRGRRNLSPGSGEEAAPTTAKRARFIVPLQIAESVGYVKERTEIGGP